MKRTILALGLVAFFLAPLLLVSCKTAQNQSQLQFDTAPLFGMIYDLDNKVRSISRWTASRKPRQTSMVGSSFRT